MTTPSGQRLVWRPDWPCQVGRMLAPLRHGGGDPTYRIVDGDIWRGVRTPDGTATLRVSPLDAGGLVHAEAWGDGASWVLGQLPAMLGAEDDPTGFEPPEVVRQTWRRNPHLRIGRSGLVMESLVPAIIEQKVTGQEAFAAYRTLVIRYGEAAPGPGTAHRLRVQPSPEDLRAIPSWEWLKLPVDQARSRPILHAAQRAAAIERAGREEPEEFERRLTSLPGIGVWTSAEVRLRALGDADAVSFGDYHVAKNVGWAMTGEETDDAGLAGLLEPYRPHRARVVQLIELAGLARPRRGPRMPPRVHVLNRSHR